MNIIKIIPFVVIFCLMALFAVTGCERIDAGYVGVKANLYGNGKGVDDATEVSGWVFYNPFATKIYEFPIFVRHKEYIGEEAFIVQAKDGMEFHISPIINYYIKRENVPTIFKKYRKPLEDIENEFLKTVMRDAYILATNEFTSNDIIMNRQLFEAKVRRNLESVLTKEGFIVQQFTSTLTYPESLKKSIEFKNNQVQQSLAVENQLKTAEASARIKVTQSKADSTVLVMGSQAEAFANKVKQASLNPLLLQRMWIEKWNGQLPTTQLGDKANTMFNINK